MIMLLPGIQRYTTSCCSADLGNKIELPDIINCLCYYISTVGLRAQSHQRLWISVHLDSLKYFRGSGVEPPFEPALSQYELVVPVFVPVDAGSAGKFQINLIGSVWVGPGGFHK